MTDHIDPVTNMRAHTAHFAEQAKQRELARLEGRLAIAEALEEEGAFDRPQGIGDDPVGLHPTTGYSGPDTTDTRTSAELRADLRRLLMEQGNPF